MQILNKPVSATPRKIIAHVLTHEITLLRLNGFRLDFQDLLFAPIMTGDSKSESQTA